MKEDENWEIKALVFVGVVALAKIISYCFEDEESLQCKTTEVRVDE
jgi:hypothetical protein